MEQSRKVFFNVFRYNIFIVYTDDIARSREDRKHILGKGDSLGQMVDGLHSYHKEEFDGYVFITPETSIGTIAHECSHAIMRMFKFFGAKYAYEHFEYHLGYLVDEAMQLKTEVDNEKVLSSRL